MQVKSKEWLLLLVLLVFYTQTKAQNLAYKKKYRIMTHNIRLDVASDGENRWELRKERVAELIRFHEPAFWGGQEVQHHQLQYLLSQLPAYKHIGVGRDDGKTKGEYSPILYDTLRFEPVWQGTFWLSERPDTVSRGWDAACNRVCTWGLFRKKFSTGFPLLLVFNTHFDHMGDTARKKSAELILRKIRELNPDKYATIVMGDFNSEPGQPAIQTLETMLFETRNQSEAILGNADTWNAFRFQEKPKGWIDHIFTYPKDWFQVRKYATLTDSYDLKYPSDHFPVLVELVF